MPQDTMKPENRAAHTLASMNRLADQLPKAARLELRKVIQQLRTGRGQGRGDAYRSWIRIRRRFSSKDAHQVLSHLPLRKESFHFLSKVEENTSLVLGWLGAAEVREGLPAWPTEHPSPAAGWQRDLDVQVGSVPGLMEIARQAGIDHGTYPGTRLPYIATVDVVSILTPSTPGCLLFIGCKPTSELLASARARERLELERRYALACGGVHRIVHEHTFHQMLVENLRWIAPRFTDLQRLQKSAVLGDFAGAFLDTCADLPVTEACEAAAATVGVPQDAEAMFRASLWLRLIDADLTVRIARTRPLLRDGGRHAEQQRSWLLG